MNAAYESADAWNRRYPPGTLVRVALRDGEPFVAETATYAQQWGSLAIWPCGTGLGCGQPACCGHSVARSYPRSPAAGAAPCATPPRSKPTTGSSFA